MNEDLKHFLEADTDYSGYLTIVELISYSKKIKDNEFSTNFTKKYDLRNKGYISIDDLSEVLKIDARSLLKEMITKQEEEKRDLRLQFMKKLANQMEETSAYSIDTAKKELLKDNKSVGKVTDLVKSKKLRLNDKCDTLFYDNEKIGYVSSDFTFTRIRHDTESDQVYVDGFPCGDLCDMYQYNALQFGESRLDVDLTTNYSEKFKQIFAQGRSLGDIDRLYELGFVSLVRDKEEEENGVYYYDIKLGKINKTAAIVDEDPPKLKFDGKGEKKIPLSEHISNGSIEMFKPGTLRNMDKFSVDRSTGEMFVNGASVGSFGENWASGKIKVDEKRDIFYNDERVGYFDDQLPPGKLVYNAAEKKVFAGDICLGEIDNLLEQKSIYMKGLDCYFPKLFLNNNNLYLDRFFVSSYKDALSKKLIKVDKSSNRVLIGDVEISKIPDKLDPFNLDISPDGSLTKNNSVESFVNFYKYCPMDMLSTRSNASRVFINETTQELSLDGRPIGKLENLIKEGRLRIDELNEIITLDGMLLANLPEHILERGEGTKYDKSPISFIEVYRAATSTRICPADGDLYQNGAFIGKISESVSNGDIFYDQSSGIISLKDDPVAFIPNELKPAKASLNRTTCEMKLDDGSKGSIESLIEKKKILPIPNYRSAYINEPLRNIYIFDKNVGTIDTFLQQKKVSIDLLTRSIWCDSVYLGTLPKDYDINSLVDVKTGIVKTTDPKVFLKAYRETDYYLNSLLEGPNKPTYIKYNPAISGDTGSKLANLSIFSTEGSGAAKTTGPTSTTANNQPVTNLPGTLPGTTTTTANNQPVTNLPGTLPGTTTTTANNQPVTNLPGTLPGTTTTTVNGQPVTNLPGTLPSTTTTTVNGQPVTNLPGTLPGTTTTTVNSQPVTNLPGTLPGTTTTTPGTTTNISGSTAPSTDITASQIKFNYSQPLKDSYGKTYPNSIVVIDDKAQIITDSAKNPVVGTTVKVDDKKNIIYDSNKNPIYNYGLLLDQNLKPILDAKSNKIYGQAVYLDGSGKVVLDANQLKTVTKITTDANGKPIVSDVPKSVNSSVPQVLLTNPDGVTKTETSNSLPKTPATTSQPGTNDYKITATKNTDQKSSNDINILSGKDSSLPTKTLAKQKVAFDMSDPLVALKIDGNKVGTIKSLVDENKVILNPSNKLFYYQETPIKVLPPNYSFMGLNYDRDSNSIKSTNQDAWKSVFNPYVVSDFNEAIYQNSQRVDSINDAIKSGNLALDKSTGNIMYQNQFLAPLNVNPEMVGIKVDPATSKITEISPDGLKYMHDTTDAPAVFPFIPSKIFDYTLKDGKVYDLQKKEIGKIDKLLADGRFSIDKDDQVVTLDGKAFTALPYHYFEKSEWKYDKENLVLDKTMNPQVLQEAYASLNVDMLVNKDNVLYKNDQKVDQIATLIKDGKIKADLKTGQLMYQDSVLGPLPADYEKLGIMIDPKSGKITENKPFAFDSLMLQGNKERFGNRYSVDYASKEVFLNDKPLGTIGKLATRGRFFLNKTSHNILLDGAYFCSLPTNMDTILLSTEKDNDTITKSSADSLYVLHYIESVSKNPPQQVNMYHRVDASKKTIYIDQKEPAKSIEELAKNKAFKVDPSKNVILCEGISCGFNPADAGSKGFSVGGDGTITVTDAGKFTEFLKNQSILSRRLKESGAYFYHSAVYDPKTSSFKIENKDIGKLEDLCKQKRLWYNPLKEELTLDGHYFKDMCQEHVKEYDIKIDPTYGYLTQAEPAKFNKLLEELETHDHDHEDDSEGEADRHHDHDDGVNVLNLLTNPDNLNHLAEENKLRVESNLRILYAFNQRVGQFSEAQPGKFEIKNKNVLIDGKEVGTIHDLFKSGQLQFNFEDVEASKAYIDDVQCQTINDCHEAFYHENKELHKVEPFDKTKLSEEDKKDFSFDTLSTEIPKSIMDDIMTIVKKSYSETGEERVIAQKIKTYLEKKRGKIWQIVISKQNLGCKVSHSEDMFANFNYKNLTYIIWKTPRSM